MCFIFKSSAAEHIFSYSMWPAKLTADAWWKNWRLFWKEYFVFFFFQLPFESFDLRRWFSWNGRFNDRWLECTLDTAVISASHKSHKWSQKNESSNAAPSAKQTIVFTHTHTNPRKKGYRSFFSFLLSLKRAVKYIKNYLQCVVFGQKSTNETK